MTCNNAVHAVQTLTKAILALEGPLILSTMDTQYNLVGVAKTICTYKLIHELLLVSKPFMNRMSLRSEFISRVVWVNII